MDNRDWAQMIRGAVEQERENLIFRCRQRAAEAAGDDLTSSLNALSSTKARLLSHAATDQRRFQVECYEKLQQLWDASQRAIAALEEEESD